MSDEVITDDFEVEVFLDLLHWSWEDAYNGTHEPERPVSPFSEPTPPISGPAIPQKEPKGSRFEWEIVGEQSPSLDSEVYPPSEDVEPIDIYESFRVIRSAAPSPEPGSFSFGQSPQSTIDHGNSSRAKAPNRKRSFSSDSDDTFTKRIRRQIRNELISVTDAELKSMAEPSKKRIVSFDQVLAAYCNDYDFHNSSIAGHLSDKQPDGSCYDDVSERREDFATLELNVSYTKYR
ncbi:hypothetical protein FANTH_2027 [Fusarium anthophilum]|uniref:Uncharacterized protein n=1 Tax=Fusarium anthophilum TaxID=48485 RepID=A0A8H5EAH8_9HYPO|nr:hypothetical protein FANTH_2027 [Fusarium anthophilum]